MIIKQEIQRILNVIELFLFKMSLNIDEEDLRITVRQKEVYLQAQIEEIAGTYVGTTCKIHTQKIKKQHLAS
jgi:hypothetical protein